MRPYDKTKVLLRNWRKADSLKDCTITPNVWKFTYDENNSLLKSRLCEFKSYLSN